MRGAFVEWGLNIPPLLVTFQFNPVELARSRSLWFGPENSTPEYEGEPGSDKTANTGRRTSGRTLRDFHQGASDLAEIQRGQTVRVQEETISFDIRLDATDKLEEGDTIAGLYGVLPQLSTLELMVQPKSAGLLGAPFDALLGFNEQGFSFTRSRNPPMILFIWGIKRMLPVNINSMNIRETEFSTMLDPIRATVSVSLTVIEGQNPFHAYTRLYKEATSALNLAGIESIANVVIPG
ncbi:MAG: hypothetical protein H0X69_10275 [Gemmatimonadales bacterium]|nr:hypothetical protein [Gemmatimonadales bacterium]